jgi:hypothetical protein
VWAQCLIAAFQIAQEELCDKDYGIGEARRTLVGKQKKIQAGDKKRLMRRKKEFREEGSLAPETNKPSGNYMYHLL